MVDYELTIDCEGFSDEKKEEVQKAFFKLGIVWEYGGNSVMHLNKGGYTNKLVGGPVTKHLMWIGNRPTHTYLQLMELAGMTTLTAKSAAENLVKNMKALDKTSSTHTVSADDLRQELTEIKSEMKELLEREDEINAELKVRGLVAVDFEELGAESKVEINSWKDLREGDILALDPEEVEEFGLGVAEGTFVEVHNNDDRSIAVYIEEIEDTIFLENWKFISRPGK